MSDPRDRGFSNHRSGGTLTNDCVTLSLRPGAELPASARGGVRVALERLQAGGATRSELESLAKSSPGEADSHRWMFELASLERQGAICLTLANEARVYAVLTPTTAPFQTGPAPSFAAHPVALSRFAYARRLGDALVLESPIAAARVELRDPAPAAWLPALARGVTVAELEAHTPSIEAGVAAMIIDLLAVAGLIAALHVTGADSDNLDLAYREWEFADLVFHRATRTRSLDQAVGGTFRFAGVTPPLPAVRPWHGGQRIDLPAPSALPHVPFQSVLDGRRSLRVHGSAPIRIDQLSTFLHHAAAIRESGEVGAGDHKYEATRRTYPSASALYPLELNLLVHRCTGLDTGAYRYDPRQHCLERVSADWKTAESVFRSTAAEQYAGPHWNVLVVMTARFARLAWKYESIAYSLLLAEAGALMQTMYLVATAMELAPCALGACDARLVQKLLGSRDGEEVAVGEFLIGSRDRV